MAIIDKSADVMENIVRIGAVLNDIEGTLKLCQAATSEVIPQNNGDKEDGVSEMPEEDKKTTIAKQTKKIQRYAKAVSILEDTIKAAQEISDYCVEISDFPVAYPIIKKVQLTVLDIKRTIMDFSIKSAKGTRKVLVECTTATGNILSMTLSPLILGMIQAFQVLSQAITLCLQGIEFVLNLLPSILSVSPHTMCFFMTPKSLKKTDMVAANPNQSICDRLPTSIKIAIEKIEDAVAVANTAIKVTTIATGASLGIASLADDEFEIPKWVCKAMEILSAASVITSIDQLLMLLPLAEPMPKYEQLKLTNIGFMIWLITGFIPAGTKTFGFPGV